MRGVPRLRFFLSREPVAQLVEHRTFNAVVAGSSPARLTIILDGSVRYAARRRSGPIARFQSGGDCWPVNWPDRIYGWVNPVTTVKKVPGWLSLLKLAVTQAGVSTTPLAETRSSSIESVDIWLGPPLPLITGVVLFRIDVARLLKTVVSGWFAPST